MTLIMGVTGIWLGGWLLDYYRSDVLDDDMKATDYALRLMLMFVAGAVPFALCAFYIAYVALLYV